MLENLPEQIRVVEVGPRDGLQNEKMILSTEDKFEFIRLLLKAGIKDIEVTSFVRPDSVAQMKDATKLYSLLNDQGIDGICLVPNQKGLENAIDCKVKEIAIFTSISNTFNLKNINCNIEESLAKILPVIKNAIDNGIRVRGYISTVFGCPYEGKVDSDLLIDISRKLLAAGCYEISLGDTIGVANPKQVQEIIMSLKNEFLLDKFSMHFHDTRGMAIANILTSLELGITSFDSSAGGIGGCPYAGGATGNIATEDLVYLMDSLGIKTSIDMEKLTNASLFILKKLGRTNIESKFLNSYLSKKNIKIGNNICV